MNKAVIQGLLGRKLRTVLTGFAVVLGVAMVSGTFVLTDTVKAAFNQIFEGSYKSTGAVISGKQVVEDTASGKATVPESLLAKVRGLPATGAASGAIYDVSGTPDPVKLIGRNGKALGTSDSPHFGWGFDPRHPEFNPLGLRSGRWASAPDEVVIDAESFKDQHYKLGDKIKVAAQGPQRTFKIAGAARFGDVDSIGGSTFAVFQVPVAQALLRKQGRFDAIFVSPKRGVSESELVNQIKPIVPSAAQVRTGQDQAKADASETNDGIKIIQSILLAFGFIALLVGGFVIFNTLSMNLAQRVRELATLRTLGASRKQVKRSVILEGFITGLVASIVGLFAGLLLALGLNALFNALGLTLPQQGLVFAPRTIIVSLLLGTGVTLLATISPARRATSVPPISAVREGATLPRSKLEENSGRTAMIVGAVSLVLLALGLFGSLSTGVTALTLGLGTLGLFVAVGLSASQVVRPLASLFGAPAERLGGAMGRLARENAMRNPQRTARTAGALMIGLALVTVVATLGAGLKTTDRNALEKQVGGDYVLTSENGFDPFTASAGDAVAKTPGVVVASDVRADKVQAFGKSVDVAGFDPQTIALVYHFRWTKGSGTSLAALAAGGAIVKKSFASDHNLKLGSVFAVKTGQGETRTLRVVGVHNPQADGLDPLFGQIGVGRSTFDAAFPRPKNQFTFIQARHGQSPAQTARLDQALSVFPDVKLNTRAAFIDDRVAGISTILNIFYVLLALSVIVSLFGMVNALALAVFERTREIGMLRAVGMTRRQTRRMVRHESVITALIGAALGLPLGVAVAAIAIRALSSAEIAFALPIGGLIAFTIVAIFAGIAAAVLPARRAGRLNVLSALQYE
jgi:putative ABC transport system permease protein